jgi:transposase
MICWRRLRDWKLAGLWEELHAILLDHLRAADCIGW